MDQLLILEHTLVAEGDQFLGRKVGSTGIASCLATLARDRFESVCNALVVVLDPVDAHHALRVGIDVDCF